MQAAAQPHDAPELLSLPETLGRGRRTRALVEALRGHLYFSTRHLQEAISTTRDVERAASALKPQDLAHLTRDLGRYCYRAGDRAGAREALERAEHQFAMLGHAVGVLSCQLALGRLSLDAGSTDRVRALASEAASTAQELGAPREEVQALLLQALADPEQASLLLDVAWGVAVESQTQALKVDVALQRATVAVRTQSADATTLTDQALLLAQQAQDIEARALAQGLLAVCRARDGAEGAAAALLAEAGEPLRREGVADSLARFRLSAARSWLALGDAERAREEAQWTMFYASEVADVPLRKEAEAILSDLGGPEAGGDRDRVRRMAELAVQVELETDPSRALNDVAHAALELLDVERAFVLLRSDSGELNVVVQAFVPGQDGEPSMSIALRCTTREGREILAADLDERSEFRAAASVVALQLRSVLCVPLVLRTGVIGAFYVDSQRVNEQDLNRDAWILRALAGHAAATVQNARRLEASERRAQQARDLAHDLNGMVTVLTLVGQELEGLEIDADDAVADLQQTTRQLHSMVRAFLTGDQPRPVTLDLDLLVSDLLGPLRRQAHQKKLTLRLDAHPARILGHREPVGRILANLCGNALKYARQEVTVQVRTTDGQVILRIQDDGPGLPEGHAETIWKRGAQAPGALPGQGLGLAIVQRLAHELGAKARVAPSVVGAAFEVVFPEVS